MKKRDVHHLELEHEELLQLLSALRVAITDEKSWLGNKEDAGRLDALRLLHTKLLREVEV